MAFWSQDFGCIISKNIETLATDSEITSEMIGVLS